MTTTTTRTLSCAAALLACGLCAAPEAAAQDPVRPVALVHARIHTMTEAGTIEDGTVLIRGETIEAVGADVTVPPGAQVIDLGGATVMPGLVHAWSTAGVDSSSGGQQLPAGIPDRFRRRFQSSRSRTARPSTTPSKKVAEQIYARQDIFGELLGAGVTTLVVHPEGSGFPGLAARLDPSAGLGDEIVDGDETFVLVAPQNTEAGAKALAEMFKKGKEALEERNKPKEEPKQPEAEKAEDKGDAKDEAKDGEKPKDGEEPKPEPKPEEGKGGDGDKGGQDPKKPAEEKKQPEKEKKKDPNAEVIADLLEAKRRAVVNLSTGADFLHWKTAMKDFADTSFPIAVVADSTDPRSGRLDQVIELVKGLEAPVLLEPELETLPYSRTLISQPKTLHEAGVEIGFVLPDNERALEGIWYQLMELVRCGLPAEVALAGLTRVPAKALGLEEEVGSLAAGRRADLLVFSGDPLDPTSTMTHVFHGGRQIPEETDAR